MDRIADHQINQVFLDRWSPRAMDGTPLPDEELMRLFEAARWAPSSGNFQPWRFIYAAAKTREFDTLFHLLVEPNQAWCKNAGALIVIISRTTLDNGRPARTHSFDTGSAWMSLALEAHWMGLVAHGMAGFDYDRARTELGIPADYAVEAMVALGHPGKIEDLSEKDRNREKPSTRRPASESVFKGKFPTP